MTFNGGTSFYDAKAPNENSYTRMSYSAQDCSGQYCNFITSFTGVNTYVDYVSFQAFVLNEWIPDNVSYLTFDYRFNFSWTDPSIDPLFATNGAFVQMTAVGHETDFQCDTAYNYGSLNGTIMSGSCKVKIKDPGHIDNLIFNWTSTKFSEVPNSNPLLVFYPNKPISVTIMRDSTLSNFQFSMDPTLDGIEEINKKIDDINQNLDDISNEQKKTNEKLDETNKNLEDINNALNDDSDVDIDKSFFDGFDTDSNSPVSDLVTMPITLFQAYINGIGSMCSPVNLGNLYGHDLILPCIDLNKILGPTLWVLIDMCFSLFLCYQIGMFCISIYEDITSLVDTSSKIYRPDGGGN
ncbi:MAG: hypothetical protein K2I67_02735 [Malacoplasma sp.]|nr:hypothetical protein [Malacoplasma sp.]